MTLTPLLGALAVVGSIGVLWWGLAARPSAGRANLFAGLPQPAPEPGALQSTLRQLGQRARRMLPNALVDGLEVSLVQAGHPHGIDLARILGIKVSLAAMTALLFLVNGKVLFAVIGAGLMFFLP